MSPPTFSLYLYDSGGKRIKKLVRKSGGWESVTYVDGIFEYHKKGSEEKNYIQLGGGIEIRVGEYSGETSGTAIIYQLKDHLGSVGIRIGQSGDTIDREEYYPFGDSSLKTFTQKRYRYCGKEKDEESGLYYYGARYYAAWVGRFVSVDPLARDYPQLTPYNYAGNKPITHKDIEGLQGTGDGSQGKSVASSALAAASGGTTYVAFHQSVAIHATYNAPAVDNTATSPFVVNNPNIHHSDPAFAILGGHKFRVSQLPPPPQEIVIESSNIGQGARHDRRVWDNANWWQRASMAFGAAMWAMNSSVPSVGPLKVSTGGAPKMQMPRGASASTPIADRNVLTLSVPQEQTFFIGQCLIKSMQR